MVVQAIHFVMIHFYYSNFVEIVKNCKATYINRAIFKTKAKKIQNNGDDYQILYISQNKQCLKRDL